MSSFLPFSGCCIAPATFTQLKWWEVCITISFAMVATPECTLIKYRHKRAVSFYDTFAQRDENGHFEC